MSSNQANRSSVTRLAPRAGRRGIGVVEIQTAFGGRLRLRDGDSFCVPGFATWIINRGAGRAVVATVRRTTLRYANEHLDADERRRYPTLSKT